ncbi:hypothetical protein COCVIDRAFT_107571, partial [Bipolaris victoriae FI3]
DTNVDVLKVFTTRSLSRLTHVPTRVKSYYCCIILSIELTKHFIISGERHSIANRGSCHKSLMVHHDFEAPPPASASFPFRQLNSHHSTAMHRHTMRLSRLGTEKSLHKHQVGLG